MNKQSEKDCLQEESNKSQEKPIVYDYGDDHYVSVLMDDGSRCLVARESVTDEMRVNGYTRPSPAESPIELYGPIMVQIPSLARETDTGGIEILEEKWHGFYFIFNRIDGTLTLPSESEFRWGYEDEAEDAEDC